MLRKQNNILILIHPICDQIFKFFGQLSSPNLMFIYVI